MVTLAKDVEQLTPIRPHAVMMVLHCYLNNWQADRWCQMMQSVAHMSIIMFTQLIKPLAPEDFKDMLWVQYIKGQPGGLMGPLLAMFCHIGVLIIQAWTTDDYPYWSYLLVLTAISTIGGTESWHRRCMGSSALHLWVSLVCSVNASPDCFASTWMLLYYVCKHPK